MSKNLKPAILNYLTKRTSLPVETVRVYLSKERRKRPQLTLNAAAHLIALKYGGTVLGKLDSDDKKTLPTIEIESDRIKLKEVGKPSRKENIFKIPELDIKEQPPLILEQNFKELKLNLEAYILLYIFENSIREFINQILASQHGEDWWVSQKFNETFKGQVEKTGNKSYLWLTKKKMHEIYFLELEQLIIILKARRRIFDEYFKMGKFDDAAWLVTKISDVNKIRRIVMHNNPITPKALNDLKTDVEKWLKQMPAIISKMSK